MHLSLSARARPPFPWRSHEASLLHTFAMLYMQGLVRKWTSCHSKDYFINKNHVVPQSGIVSSLLLMASKPFLTLQSKLGKMLGFCEKRSSEELSGRASKRMKFNWTLTVTTKRWCCETWLHISSTMVIPSRSSNNSQQDSYFMWLPLRWHFSEANISSPDLSSSSLLSPPPHRPNPHLSTVSYFPSSFLSSFRLLPRNPLRCLRLCNQSRLSSTYRHPSSTTTINDHRISLRIHIRVGSLSCFHHSRWYSLSRAVNLK